MAELFRDKDDESVIKQRRARKYGELLTDEELSNPPSAETNALIDDVHASLKADRAQLLETDEPQIFDQEREVLAGVERFEEEKVRAKEEKKAAALDVELGAIAVRATELLKLLSLVDPIGLPPASVAELSQLRKRIERLRQPSPTPPPMT